MEKERDAPMERDAWIPGWLEMSLANLDVRASVIAMNPRLRRILFLGLCLWVISGLVLCGPAHHALHDLSGDGAHSSASGIYCDGCSLSGLEFSAPVFSIGPTRECLVTRELPPLHVASSAPLLHRSPRGPPFAA
jgi:hypothetical protein